jgi:hypothetical protein
LLFSITKAAITPGTHPQQVNKNTIKIEPQPLSRTAKGGKIIHKIRLKQDIVIIFSKYTMNV